MVFMLIRGGLVWGMDLFGIKHVKKIIEEKDRKNLCPKCGSELILRVAKKGANAGNEFYGCSNYPTCRYTAQVV